MTGVVATYAHVIVVDEQVVRLGTVEKTISSVWMVVVICAAQRSGRRKAKKRDENTSMEKPSRLRDKRTVRRMPMDQPKPDLADGNLGELIIV